MKTATMCLGIALVLLAGLGANLLIDHGGLEGLGDDDHAHYLLSAGDTMTGDLLVDGGDEVQFATISNYVMAIDDDTLLVNGSTGLVFGIGGTGQATLTDGALLFGSDNEARFRDSGQSIRSNGTNSLELDSVTQTRFNINGGQELRLNANRLIMVHATDPNIESAFTWATTDEVDVEIDGMSQATFSTDGLDVVNEVRAAGIIVDGDTGGTTGTTTFTNATAALGAFSQATLGNVPAGVATAQKVWVKIYIGGTVTYFPAWQ